MKDRYVNPLDRRAAKRLLEVFRIEIAELKQTRDGCPADAIRLALARHGQKKMRKYAR